jgi:hypothetical protein
VSRAVHSVTSEGPVVLTQYETGDAVIYNVETGDAFGIEVGELAAVGRLAIAAHVAAGQLRNPDNIGRMKAAPK